MAVNLKVLVDGTQLSTTSTTHYTAPSGTVTRIDKATITNTTDAQRIVDIYLVKSGESARDKNRILANKAIPAKTAYGLGQELEGHVLETGDTIRAKCNAVSSVTLRVSGIEVT